MSDNDITVDQARGILRRAYWDDVREIIRDAKDEITSGNLARDEDTIREYLHETVDGHQRVIYAHLNFETLLCCSNEDAYTQDFGGEGVVTGGAVNWSVLAHAALYNDVMQQADSDGLFDVPDDDIEEDDGDE